MIISNTSDLGRITGVSATNFKSRDFHYSLSPVTVICGENFIGKSTILNAIQIGLYGYHAAVGKQPGATWDFAGPGKEMTIRLEFEHTAVQHKWTRNAKGAVSFKNGLEFEVPTVLLDARQYLAMSNEDRIKTVFAMCDTSDFKCETVIDALRAIEVIPTKISAPIITQLADYLHNLPWEPNASDWLAARVESCKSKLKEAQAVAKHLAGNTQAFTPRVLLGTPPADVSQELAEARTKLQAIDSQIAVAKANEEQILANATRRQEIEAALAEAPDFESAIASIESEAAAWDIEDSNKDSILKESYDIEAKITANSRRLAELRKVGKALDAEYVTAMGNTECPTCGANREGWKDKLKTSIKKKQADNASFERECQAEYAKLQASQAACKAKMEAAIKIEHANEAALKAIDDCKSKIQDLKNAQVKIQSDREELTRIDQVKLIELPANINEQRDAAAFAVTGLEERQRAFDAVQNDRQRAGAEEQKLLAVNVNIEVLKLAIKTIVGVQEQQVAKAFNVLLAKTRVFTDGILLSPLEYRDGDLGRAHETDGHWISHRVLSGCEQSLAYVSLSIALAQHSPIKVVMFDEASMTFSPGMKAKVIDRMLNLVRDGVIHNCMLADPDRSFWANYKHSDGNLSIINLDEK